MSSSGKGNFVKLKTFQSWGKCNIIGHKTVLKDGITYVNFIWCKVCAKNESVIKADKSCKGEVAEAMLQFVKGMSNVTKHTVMRHLQGKAHKIAILHEDGMFMIFSRFHFVNIKSSVFS